MGGAIHRFTISIPSDLNSALNIVKQNKYSKTNQNEMIRDLIARGVASLTEKPRVMKSEEK